MINGLWLLPAFTFGGFMGFMTMALLIAAKED